MDREDFADLVHQAEQLNTEMSGGIELPRVERNLTQLMENAERFSSRSARLGQDATSVQA